MAARTPVFVLTITALAAACSDTSSKEKTMEIPTISTNEQNVAIDGYDPVSFFGGEPVPGSSEYRHSWAGADWHFSSAERRDQFAAAPERFAPQYGGHCAFAMSLGKTEQGKPTQWKLVGDKLYLNSNGVAKFLWSILPGRIAKGDANWAN